MGKKDKRVDDYIANSAEFAKPILKHLRKLVHQGCPKVEETMKWSFPHFDYKGMLCSMAAFKQHCTLGFWKARLMKDAAKLNDESAMGSFGRITSLKNLPSDSTLIGYIQEAAELNECGAKLPPRKRSTEKKELEIPKVLTDALRNNIKANETFQNFSYSHKKEYVEWIAEAKTQETRDRRVATTLEWLSEGKRRHWKYQKC